METVRYVATAPFRAVWYLVSLPVLAILWLLVLLRRAVWAIVSVPVYYLGRFRERAAITWDWTKKRGRARLCLPWWGQTCNLKATQSTQTLEEDEDDDQYATPLALPLLSPGQQLDLSSLHQRHPLLNPELFRKLQKVARRRSSSQSQRQAIAALLALYLEQVSPASSPVESEREEGEQRKSTASPADPESVPPYHMVRDEKSLRLILDLMSLSNSSGSGDKHAQEQARRQKAQEIASVYQYDSGKLQELISELDQVSFEMDGGKKARRGKERQSRHSQLRHRHHRSSPPRRTRPQHSPKPRPHSDSDSESPSEACVTAEDRFSDEEPHTSEYHSPPEEFSDSEEEEEERKRGRGKGSATASFSQGRRREMGRGREKGKGGSPKGSKPPPRAVVTAAAAAAAAASVQEAREESQPFVSERQRASFGGVLSPVQESPEYMRTPSTHNSAGSENELENDLNKALSQLNSETNDLKADAKEVEIIEQMAARISRSSQSSSPSSPFLTSPATPNTVVWEKGTCVVVSSTPDPVQTEKEDRDKKEAEEEEEEEEGGKGEDEETKDKVTEKAEGERERDREETKAKGEEFPAIPKMAPSLGLKEGHDRQQLAVTRSSTRRRPPTRRTASQDESSSAAAVGQDLEMERLEKQMQQSVDSLSTLLVEQEGGGKGEREEDERTEAREGEGEGGEDEDSQSEGEESESEQEEEDEEEGEPPVKPKKLPGAVRVLPSLSDQMHLLSPGSLQQERARELSPEALLEESLYSISKPIPIAASTGKRAQANPDAATRPTNISTTSAAGPSSTTSSPGTSWPQRQFGPVQTPQRPRSNSLDAGVHRKTAMQAPTPPPVDRGIKPLMIPSSLPPWIEMRKTTAVPMQPLAPKPPTHTFSPTEQQPAPEVPRTRSSSDPPVMDAIYDVLPKKQEPEPTEPIEQQPEAVEQDSIYDCLQPARKDDRIYELPPIKYLHQTIPASPATPAKSHRSGREDEEAAREERKKQSSSEKPRSSRDSRESRSHEKERERERGREERRHRGSPSDRDREAHSSKHSSSERHSSSKDHSSERKHRSHSREHDKPSSSSSRKHGSSSKSSSDRKESAYSSSKKTSSSSSKEKEAKASKSSSKSKTEKSDSSRSKADSSRSSKSERDRHHRHSERSSRHRDEERGERVLSVLPRSPSRISIMSTSAIVSSSRTQPHHESLKKTTSLSSLATSGSGSSARPSPVLDHDSKETLV